jgi:hypothetical protein|tara:strand:+ start:255 stop:605 length:351 start_codon:yes stop_codon:yes gene_type:complete
MPHKVVKYRLTSEGTIPTFLKFGVSENTGGMYAVADSGTASPQDWIMIGISDDGADISDAVEEVTSKANLQTYLSTQATANSWTDPDPDDLENRIAFDAAAHAQRVWDDLDALNAA